MASITVTFRIEVTGGSETAPIASAIKRRLTASTGMRYCSEAETIFYMLERMAEDLSDAPGHAIARVVVSATEVL